MAKRALILALIFASLGAGIAVWVAKREIPEVERWQGRYRELDFLVLEDELSRVEEDLESYEFRVIDSPTTGLTQEELKYREQVAATRDKLLARKKEIQDKIAARTQHPILVALGASHIKGDSATMPTSIPAVPSGNDSGCIACHITIANTTPRYSKTDPNKLDPVFRVHPKLSLFVAENSKHAMGKMGCTVCHGGDGSANTFASAGHSPLGDEQKKEWEKNHRWSQEKAKSPMLPVAHTEASCVKCHIGSDRTPEAERLTEGRRHFEEIGCVNCHAGASTPELAWVGRVGPDLHGLHSKTTSDWTRRWIADPQAFRPSTAMPRIFDATDAHAPKTEAETEAIATYLFNAGVSKTVTAPPSKGNIENGKKLFTGVGCLACHSTTGAKEGERFAFSEHGPDLSRIGEKVSPQWLYSWLKNPKHYWAETRMPSLRLTDVEAADITAYVMTLVSAEAKPQPLASAAESAFDALIDDKSGDPLAAIDAKFKAGAEWSESDITAAKTILGQDKRTAKAFLAGAELIERYGCYGCHAIKGFASGTGPALDLGTAAKKIRDTGAWSRLSDILTKPSTGGASAGLKHPWFGAASTDLDGKPTPGLSAREINTLQTYVLSLGASAVPPELIKTASSEQIKIDHGERTLRALNCTGCHMVGAEQRNVPERLPLESFIALLQPKAQAELKKFGGSVYVDEKFLSLKYTDPDNAANTLDGFINIERGTLLSGTATPIMLFESPVKDPSGKVVLTGLQLVKGSGKKPKLVQFNTVMSWELFKDRMSSAFPDEAAAKTAYEAAKDQYVPAGNVPLGSMITPDAYRELIRPIVPSSKLAKELYEKQRMQFVDPAAYERVAGTKALRDRGVLSYSEYERRVAAKATYEPASVKVRFTRGEGRIINHQENYEKDRLGPVGSRQQGPPSLGYEGGKVHAEWMREFLRDVQILRPGLMIRMPSFWDESAAPKAYPTGRRTAKEGEATDDVGDLAQYFAEDAKVTTPRPAPRELTEAERRLYEKGKHYVMGPETKDGTGGMGCVNCHIIGSRVPAELKFAPNLARVKNRIREEWLHRFLVNPASIYWWTNMPNNFNINWDTYTFDTKEAIRGMCDEDEEVFKKQAEKLQAVKFFLLNVNDADVGEKKTP